MEWHINDLSLSGQFADPQTFRVVLEPLLQLRHRDPLLQSRLYCSRALHECKVTAIYDLKSAVRATGDKAYIGLVLEWAAKSGPFWDDNRQSEEDDYFEYKGLDVTNQGLGEAARRRLARLDANTFSFEGSGFESSPLCVQHGLPEEPIGFVDVINHWQIVQLRTSLDSCRAINGWSDVQEEVTRRFGLQLIIAENAIDALMATPFSNYAASRIIILLGVLNKLVEETEENGEFSLAGRELYTTHFVGKKAWFTDESQGNKVNFEQDMTFSDPRDAAKKLFCAFHGKIKSPQIRIHFEWPRPEGQREIKVVYIGPKITKE
jgi:hypothetical protein